MNKVSLDMLFKLKKGTKLRLRDDRVIELTSNYDADIVGYRYIEVGKDNEEIISSLTVRNSEIL